MSKPTRRDVLMATAALGLRGSSAFAAAETGEQMRPSEMATGSVYERAREGSDRTPLPGVLVSNGRDVVKTDVSGRFSLSVEPGQAIFVIKPSGYRLPTDPATGLARFSYVHDPMGTPPSLGFRYDGLAPTGPLPASVDFELIRDVEANRFDVVLITDPQPESTIEIAYIRDAIVAGLMGRQAAFGLTCGDIAFDDLAMYPRINDLIGCVGLPWWNIGGNHDLDFEAPDAARARDTYKRVFGAPYYAHEYGNALFVMLDNVDYLGVANLKGEGEPNYRGLFSKDQLTFVEKLLTLTPRDKLVVLVMHIPLKTYLGSDPSRNTVNAADFLGLLGDRPSVSFAGHTHSTEHHYFGTAEGFGGPVPHHHHVLTAASGSWWSGPQDHRGIASADSYDGTPNGYHILSIDGARYTTSFFAANEPGKQIRISFETQFHQRDRQVEAEVPMVESLGSPISIAQVSGTLVYANVFDGGPRTQVELLIDGEAPSNMTRVSRPDPFIEQVYGRHPEALKKWVKPQNSSHLWSARLPTRLGVGTHRVQVSAVDEYGRPHSETAVLEVV